MQNFGPARPAVPNGELDPGLPPMVYLPSQRLVPGTDEAQLELRRLVDGRLAAVAYTTRERLVQGCGESQPWVLLPTQVLEECRERLGIEAVVLDAELPPELRHDEGGGDV
ncbi:MAG: SAV_915 family protein [Pseudonocardiaceae bacterium]